MSKTRPRRDFANILTQIKALSPTPTSGSTARNASRHSDKYDQSIGLTLAELEDDRWSVSPSVARAFIEQAGLPYEGRRARVIYSWRSILKAEGLPEDVALQATQQTHPDLFENLLDTAQAAAFLGYRDSSSIRKLLISGSISRDACIHFGNRKVYRIRVSALRQLRHETPLRIV